MAKSVGVRMSGGVVWTASDAWDYAFNSLCKAGDDLEEPEAQLAAALAGVGWVAAAIAIEHGRPQDPNAGGEE